MSLGFTGVASLPGPPTPAAAASGTGSCANNAPAPGPLTLTPASFVLCWSSGSLTDAGGPIAQSSPMVATLDNGGQAVVVGDRAGYLYAYHLADGSPVEGWPVDIGQPIDSTPSVAALAGGGLDDVFIGTGDSAQPHPGAYWAYSPGGSELWSTLAPNPASDPNPESGVAASLTVTDLEGLSSVFAGSLGQESYGLNATTGSVLPGWPFFSADTNFSTAAAGDLYGNGQEELVMGGASHAGIAYGQSYANGGHVRVLDAQGNLIYDYDTNQEIDSSPAIGEFLAGGATGIAVGAGTYYAGTSDTDTVKAFTTRLGLVWSDTLDGPTTSSPALADVEGNGSLDVVEGTRTGSTTGSAWALDGVDGSQIWTVPAVSAIIGSVVTANLTGRDYQDVLVPTVHGVEVLNGPDGAEVTVLGPLVGFQNSPLISDDPNGTVGITIAGYNGDNEGVVQHYEIIGSNGALALGAGSWPMFHHDPTLSGVSSPLPDPGTVTPVDLTAEAGENQVSLSWAAPTGGLPPTGYNLYQATVPGHEQGAPLNGSTPISTTNYSVTGLTGGQKYYFEVTAINPAGEGAPSNQATATPQGTSGTPSPPPTTTVPTTTTAAALPPAPAAPIAAPAPTTTVVSSSTTAMAPASTTTSVPSTTAKPYTPPKKQLGRPVVAELTEKTNVSGGKVRLRLACSGTQCRGAIKLWYENILISQETYNLSAGVKSVFSLALKSNVIKRLHATRRHKLLLTETVTLEGGSTVRRTLQLSP